MAYAGIVLYNGCTYFEIAETVFLLQSAGITPEFLAQGNPIKTSEGLTILTQSHMLANPEQLSAVVIPGGDPYSIRDDFTLHAWIAKACQRTVVGGICNGAMVLGWSGALKGKKCTHTITEKYNNQAENRELFEQGDKAFAGAVYIDQDVVLDDKIVTAKPWASPDFAKTVLSCIAKRH